MTNTPRHPLLDTLLRILTLIVLAYALLMAIGFFRIGCNEREHHRVDEVRHFEEGRKLR